MSRSTTPLQLAFTFPHPAGYRLEDFLPAPCNQAAVDAVLAWPHWPTPALVLHGPPGSGRTHLAHIWCDRAQALLMSGAELWEVANPLERLGEARALAVDDADLVAAPRLLLQLYNLLVERGGHLLLTATAPPDRWGIRLPDLLSRLKAAASVRIEPPDDALLAALLVKQLADRRLSVAPSIVAYLVARMDRSFAAAGQLVEALDRASLRARRPVTMGLARQALAEMAEMAAREAQAEG